MTYSFVANYFGGTGNDLVLQWADTTPMAWGLGTSGELGNGLDMAKSAVPVAVSTSGVLAGRTVIAMAGGAAHNLALCSDGTVAAWGEGGEGELGNNTGISSAVPVAVNAVGVLSGRTVIAVAAGSDHSLALCADGTVAAWGGNEDGQLGTGNTTASMVPVAVSAAGVLAGRTVVAFSAGTYHNLALCSDGSVVAWGDNQYGQLGNDGTASGNVPGVVDISGVLAGKTVIAVRAGASHSLALCSDGTLVAWGRNNAGQLGNNSTTDSMVPVEVSAAGVLAGKTVLALAAGASHSLALCSDGTLAAWGFNTDGELGNNSTAQSSVPVAVSRAGVLAGKTVITVSAGQFHSLALCSDGTLAAWGYGGDGELGSSSTGSSVPLAVSTASLPAGSRFVMGDSGPGASHSLALVDVPAPYLSIQQPVGTSLVRGVSSVDFGGAVPGRTVIRVFTVKNTGKAVFPPPVWEW